MPSTPTVAYGGSRAIAAGVELGAGALFLATLALSFAATGLSFKYFESRFLRTKERFERSTSPSLRAA